MPKRSTGTVFTAGKPISLEGVLYNTGDTIPGAVLSGLRRLSALIGRGFIVVDRDVYGRQRATKRVRVDRTFNHAERRTLGA